MAPWRHNLGRDAPSSLEVRAGLRLRPEPLKAFLGWECPVDLASVEWRWPATGGCLCGHLSGGGRGRAAERFWCVPSLPQHFSTDPVAASIMKIHTFNRDRDKVKLGVDTIAK